MRIFALVFTLTAGVLAISGVMAQEEPDESGQGEAPTEQAPADGRESQPAAPAPAERYSHWFNKAAEAYREDDIEAWVEATTELHRMRPYNQDFMRHLVEAHAQLGNLNEAFATMLKMQQQGLAEDWSEVEAVEPMREYNLYDHIDRLMTSAGEPFGDVETWSRIGTDHPMPEALAYDGERERMYAGTVRDGRILVSEDGEGWEIFASPDSLEQLQAVFDLAVDHERGHLWVATGRAPFFDGKEREDGVRSALLRLDLESGELQAEYPLSSGSGRNLLGSLAVAGDGTVFAADTQAPVVYHLEPGGESLRPFFGHQNFTSLRGIALNDDDSLLYVADYELGVFIVDATSGQEAWKLAGPETLNLGGIDGLFWWDDHLLAIQNGITPERIIRLKLGGDGLGVEAVAPLAAAREEFDTPTFGVMDDEILYFLAASHWEHVDPQGNLDGELSPVPIMRIDVDSASVRNVGQEVLDELMENPGQNVPTPAPEEPPPEG